MILNRKDLCNDVENNNNNKIQNCSSSQKLLTGSRSRACLKNRLTGTRVKPVLTSALTLIQNGPSFPQLLAGSTRVRPGLGLGGRPCLKLAAASIENTYLTLTQTFIKTTPGLGDATISIGFRKNFPPIEWSLNLIIKL